MKPPLFLGQCPDSECMNNANHVNVPLCSKCGLCGSDSHLHTDCDSPETVRGRSYCEGRE